MTLMVLDIPQPQDGGRDQLAMAIQAECLLRDAVAVLFISEVRTLKDASPEELRGLFRLRRRRGEKCVIDPAQTTMEYD